MKGNKGEWSELYAFFRLLTDTKLFSADENMNKTKSFVEILSIRRKENGKDLSFEIHSNKTVQVVDIDLNSTVQSFEQKKAEQIADKLVGEITGNRKISNDLIESIKALSISKVSDKTPGKGDIKIKIYDPVHSISSEQEFSIKSFLGSKPTLFNANKTTNIKYQITDSLNNPITDDDLEQVNSITTGSKYIKRIATLLEMGYNINFHSYDDQTFKLNLEIIDSDLPKIIAHVVKDKYVSSITKFEDVIEKLRSENPMNYDLSQGHRFYEYRLVNFLVESALGMTSKSVWSGKYDVVGGIIVIKQDTEMLCYHLIDFNKFKHYLKKNSRLDNPSGSKYDYGYVFKNEEGSFIKLNFQVKA